MLHGSETWPMRAEHEAKLERTEMRMIRWMCGVSLRERKTSAELREWIGVEAVGDVMRRNRLRWFGHVERSLQDDWVKKCGMLEVEGRKPRGRPKKTWMEVVVDDMRRMGLTRKRDAQDRGRWRMGIWDNRPTQVNLDNPVILVSWRILQSALPARTCSLKPAGHLQPQMWREPWRTVPPPSARYTRRNPR